METSTSPSTSKPRTLKNRVTGEFIPADESFVRLPVDFWARCRGPGKKPGKKPIYTADESVLLADILTHCVNGSAWLYRAELAAASGVTLRTVDRLILKLVKFGHLRLVGAAQRGGEHYHYCRDWLASMLAQDGDESWTVLQAGDIGRISAAFCLEGEKSTSTVMIKAAIEVLRYHYFNEPLGSRLVGVDLHRAAERCGGCPARAFRAVWAVTDFARVLEQRHVVTIDKRGRRRRREILDLDPTLLWEVLAGSKPADAAIIEKHDWLRQYNREAMDADRKTLAAAAKKKAKSDRRVRDHNDKIAAIKTEAARRAEAAEEARIEAAYRAEEARVAAELCAKLPAMVVVPPAPVAAPTPTPGPVAGEEDEHGDLPVAEIFANAAREAKAERTSQTSAVPMTTQPVPQPTTEIAGVTTTVQSAISDLDSERPTLRNRNPNEFCQLAVSRAFTKITLARGSEPTSDELAEIRYLVRSSTQESVSAT